MEKALSMKRFGVQCTLAVVITVAFYAILYNLKFLAGYLAIFAAGVPALAAALAGQFWRKDEVTPVLTAATGAYIMSTLLSLQHTLSLLFWWQEPGQAGTMFLYSLGMGVVAMLCLTAFMATHAQTPSNWALKLMLVFTVFSVAIGIANDVAGGSNFGWGELLGWPEYKHPLEKYVVAIATLLAVLILGRFAPAPNLEKWRARQERDRAREADRLRAEIAELEATSLR